ncbi:MAG TPA: hypothetical protein VFV10_01925 [Gammaproteobacteria bacterium]|nr:hypothetical protein [Gammaproteobacteria bacterium]
MRQRGMPWIGAGRRIGLACTAFAAAAVLAGCAANPTRFSSTWQDPTYSGPPLEPVVVLALFDTEAESRNFETRATDLLKQRGVRAVAGHSVLEPGQEYTQEQMEDRLKQADAGGVLIFRLIAVDERQRYRNPSPYLRPFPPGVVWGDPFYWYYYPHWNYYWYWRSSLEVTGAPGYWEQATYYVIESSLYDNKTNELIWTAKSETLDGTRFESVAESVADAVADRLLALNLIKSEGTSVAEKKEPGIGKG